MNLTPQETATVLASLRHWQNYLDGPAKFSPIGGEFAGHFDDELPLSIEEVNDLCERINFDTPEDTWFGFEKSDVENQAKDLAEDLKADDDMDHTFAPFEIEEAWKRFKTDHYAEAESLNEEIREILNDIHCTRHNDPIHAERWAKELASH